MHNALIYIRGSILWYIISTTSKSKIATTFVNTKLTILEYIYLLEIEYS